ncbi:hypothetical protein OG339_33725 [Streptosporangium sp. NBC_01495]|uniref:hypothetical protein n=1 Tax=Streptosporangium sp. NBC_01495 TaxID=2903899 RepID=UPI002E378FD7|nr:hypothetical protein [Streptosporangium sp. NBC_01495]
MPAPGTTAVTAASGVTAVPAIAATAAPAIGTAVAAATVGAAVARPDASGRSPRVRRPESVTVAAAQAPATR